MSHAATALPTLDAIVAASAAEPAFAEALKALAAGGDPGPAIKFNSGCPPVKVRRVLAWLLETHPRLAVRSAAIQGASGCSDFRGRLTVEAADGAHGFDFAWDCAWKAEQLGWKTFWGDPDQQKAAKELDYRCMEKFEEVKA